jgi:hypothetical protein
MIVSATPSNTENIDTGRLLTPASYLSCARRKLVRYYDRGRSEREVGPSAELAILVNSRDAHKFTETAAEGATSELTCLRRFTMNALRITEYVMVWEQ